MLRNWKLKLVVQKCISFLPYSNHINLFFQKHITKGVELTDDHYRLKLRHAIDHMVNFEKNGSSDKSTSTVLEIGTGWYPIVPLLAFLCGYNKIISFDINAWLKKPSILTAVNKILANLDGLSSISDQLYSERIAILQQISAAGESMSLEKILQTIRLEPRVEDFTQSDLAEGSIDYICSNNTYEHIYRDVLEKILQKFKLILNPTGTMSHFIDMSDHFAHFDTSITAVSYTHLTLPTICSV